jgi:hypothetical protein
MIDENTPSKLADIIRDTWPNLYRAPKDFAPPSKTETLSKPVDFQKYVASA